jgi:hypothetical protein
MTLDILYNSIPFLSEKITQERLSVYEKNSVVISKQDPVDQIMEESEDPDSKTDSEQFESLSSLNESQVPKERDT